MAGRSAAPQSQTRLTPEGLLIFTRGRRWARSAVQDAAGVVGGEVGEAFAALPADRGASALRVALRRTWPGSLTGANPLIWAVPLPTGAKAAPSPEGFTLHDVGSAGSSLGGVEQRQGRTMARIVVEGDGRLDVEEAPEASALVSSLAEAYAVACGEVPGALFGRTVEELLGRSAVPVGSALYVPGGDPEASGVLASIVKLDGMLGAPSGALGFVLADFGTRDASQIEAVAQGWAQRAAAELSAAAEKIREAWAKAQAAKRDLHKGAQKAAETRALRALSDAERWRPIVGDLRANALRDAARELETAASCGDLLDALAALNRLDVAAERLPEIGHAPRGGAPQAMRTPAAAPVAPLAAPPPAPLLPTPPSSPPLVPLPPPAPPLAPPVRTGRDLINRIGERLRAGEGVAVGLGSGAAVIAPPPPSPAAPIVAPPPAPPPAPAPSAGLLALAPQAPKLPAKAPPLVEAPPAPAPPAPPPSSPAPAVDAAEDDLWSSLPSEEDPILLPPETAEDLDLWDLS